MAGREPDRLAAGKAFNTLAQSFYGYGSSFEGEQQLFKASGRRGRADIFMFVDAEQRFAAIAEVKNTDWSELAARGTLRRNLARKARQLWQYLDGTFELEDATGSRRRLSLAKVDRYGAMVFPHAPEPAVRTRVEEGFGEYGLSVVWLDEPPPEDSEAFAAWQTVLAGSRL